jgi:hypothetical protein
VPTFEVTQRFPFARRDVFDFFAQPANVVAIAPPGLTLVEAPERLAVGSRVTVTLRRYGLTTTVVTEVVVLIEIERIVEVQVRGPLKSWRLEREYVEIGGAVTEVCERIVFEPPGGLLGRTLTARRIEEDLRDAYQMRHAAAVEAISRMVNRHTDPPQDP